MNLDAFVAFDPGEHFGYGALFRLGVLQNVFRDPIEASWASWGGVTSAIVERPVLRDKRAGSRQSKARPDDIVRLAVAAGLYAGPYRFREFVTPEGWKGQLPKDVMNARVWSELSEVEREAFTQCYAAISKPGPKHNYLDAVGIGLWRLGRLCG